MAQTSNSWSSQFKNFLTLVRFSCSVLLANAQETNFMHFEFRDSTFEYADLSGIYFPEYNWVEANLEELDGISRSGDTLSIDTEVGSIQLVNSVYNELLENYEAANFKLLSLDSEHKIIDLGADSYEWSSHLWIDLETGRQLETNGAPIFSPDGSLIFCSNVDLETNFTQNGFEVYQRTHDGFIALGTMHELDWTIARATWINNRTLSVVKATVDDKYQEIFQSGLLTLELKD